jgi:hypothetical protein
MSQDEKAVKQCGISKKKEKKKKKKNRNINRLNDMKVY